MVGGREAYEARCRACHVVRPAMESQRDIFPVPEELRPQRA
jgi:thymidine kinase